MRRHGNTLCSNQGDTNEDGERGDFVDCHGNTGWAAGRVSDEIDRALKEEGCPPRCREEASVQVSFL